MLRAIVGTAGHIDHGKTRLIEALTGIDCDRWQEEKERGITIDLGFAHLVEDDLQLGFIDVPGHERFVHNALAGMGGIRVVLLVVAADEGVKPQTREHLEICRLLEIPAAVVALTKLDAAGGELADLAELEVAELLADTPYAAAPVLRVSAVAGTGIDELRRTLVELGRRAAVDLDHDRPARLPIDRAFTLRGLGVVVTGTLAAGAVRAGDELELLPGGARVRVRSLQVHGQAREEALPGERTSLQITGATTEALRRGQQLVAPGTYAASHSLLARYRAAPGARPLTGWSPARVHLLATETTGRMRPVAPERLEPGEEGLVEIRLGGPVVAIRGDRFVVRRPSPAATLGGGTVLDPRWHRRRGSLRREAAEALAAGDPEALQVWIEEAGEGGTTTGELARRLGRRPGPVGAVLARMAKDGHLLRATAGGEDRWLSPRVVKRVTERARRLLTAWFAKERLADGMPKAEAVRRILRARGAELAGVYLEWLSRAKVLAVAGDLVTLPGRKAALTEEESGLAETVATLYEEAGLTPPGPGELSSRLGAKPQIFEGIVGYLVRQGRIVKLPGGLLLSRRAWDELVAAVRAEPWERFSVPTFKDRFGLSRKWAIPLLEKLDSDGVTRRAGDDRLVVRSG